jgi:anti-sigma regulatory factor (Ser/Thr protein kinase)
MTFGDDRGDIPQIEKRIASLPFLTREERERLTIIGSEILDNVLSYAQELKDGKVVVRVSKGKSASMVFMFKSRNFADFAKNERDSERRYFDPRARRYRGLGLTMCRNLAASLRFRSGERLDSIIVRL